jgi:hypothetical protein
MNLTITKRVQLKALPKTVPRAFSHYCPGLRLTEPITLVVFDDAVVNSGLARKAIKKLASEGSACTVFVGVDFTQEAREVIRLHGGELLARVNFGWTDESHETIRILIGARVKKPDWR